MRNINKKGINASILDQLKNCKKNFKIITQYKYHHWILRTISRWLLRIRGWWITVQNCAKRKRTSIDSSKPIVEYHEYGSQESNNVEMKVKPSSVHLETVASTKRENPGLLESSSGGSGISSSNPLSIASEKEVHLNKERNPSRGQNLGLKFLDDKRAEDTPLILIFKYEWFDTMVTPRGRVYTLFWQEDSWEVSYELEGVILPVFEKKNGKESMYKDC